MSRDRSREIEVDRWVEKEVDRWVEIRVDRYTAHSLRQGRDLLLLL